MSFQNDIDAAVVYMGRMDLRALRYFVSVADHLSFSRAAGGLRVSQ
jgi:hypothetical protein